MAKVGTGIADAFESSHMSRTSSAGRFMGLLEHDLKYDLKILLFICYLLKGKTINRLQNFTKTK